MDTKTLKRRMAVKVVSPRSDARLRRPVQPSQRPVSPPDVRFNPDSPSYFPLPPDDDNKEPPSSPRRGQNKPPGGWIRPWSEVPIKPIKPIEPSEPIETLPPKIANAFALFFGDFYADLVGQLKYKPALIQLGADVNLTASFSTNFNVTVAKNFSVRPLRASFYVIKSLNGYIFDSKVEWFIRDLFRNARAIIIGLIVSITYDLKKLKATGLQFSHEITSNYILILFF